MRIIPTPDSGIGPAETITRHTPTYPSLWVYVLFGLLILTMTGLLIWEHYHPSPHKAITDSYAHREDWLNEHTHWRKHDA